MIKTVEVFLCTQIIHPNRDRDIQKEVMLMKDFHEQELVLFHKSSLHDEHLNPKSGGPAYKQCFSFFKA